MAIVEQLEVQVIGLLEEILKFILLGKRGRKKVFLDSKKSPWLDQSAALTTGML